MSAQVPNLDVLVPGCVYTDLLAPLVCDVCYEHFTPERSNQVNCSPKCRWEKKREVREEKRKEAALLRRKCTNIAFAHLNRDRSIGFDGRYEGPLNQCFTVDVQIRKDVGYHSMPIDVHVRPVEPKHSVLTPEDHDWATRQRAFPHTLNMPRAYNSWCAHCVEMVIDAAQRSVRVTRGVYLPIEHNCGKVRVYDLQGKLLEVKQL